MTELEFSERLKRFRKANNMTQQELADKLGVSNKSVSRWESGGGYPDVALLAPLAAALGVTVDDLLCDKPPVRKLGTADWQNLLSFAFAIGGGVGYFLLDLFMPALVCYLLYLGAMAYGAYLQIQYTYHSRWFHLANSIMNFFVNAQLLSALSPLFLSSTAASLSNYFLLRPFSGEFPMESLLPLAGYLLVWLALSGLLTALTQYVICRKASKQALHLSLERAPMTWRKAVPALLPVLLLLFWGAYSVDLGDKAFVPAPLPEWMYRNQMALYLGLTALCVLVCAALFWKKGRRGMLVPSLALTLGSSALLALLADSRFACSNQGNIVVTQSSNPDYYTYFLSLRWQMVPAAAALVLIYLLLCRVRINLSNITSV